MHSFWHPRRIRYDGSQMAPHWAYLSFDAEGDSIVAFHGACSVRPSLMLDLEDRKKGAVIRGPLMIHWIVEHFDRDLERSVLRQRLLACIVKEAVERRSGRLLRRDGDDLYDGKRKLSISIAAPTAVSCKIHFAVNIRRARRVGVPTEGIAAYGIPPEELGWQVAEAYAAECAGVQSARVKARAVR